jgi:hypothetical protein
VRSLFPEGENLEERHRHYTETRDKLEAAYNCLIGIARQYPEFQECYEHRGIRLFPPALAMSTVRDVTPPANATVKNTTTVEPKLTIEKWSNLGVGVDADGKYLGVSPCPERYGVFPREKAVILDLPGNRWKKILDILALSEHGNTAEKLEVMQQFGYIQSGEISPDDIPELAENSRKMETLNQASKSLTSAIADLGRELRAQVKGPTGNGAPTVLSVASEGEVQAAFFVRHLVVGHDGKLRFGEEPVDRR